jgi:hypothetical protein
MKEVNRVLQQIRTVPDLWLRRIPLLAVVALCTLSSGCLVLRGQCRYKPDAPHDEVKAHKNSDDLKYSRVFEYPDFDLEIGAKDGRVLWDAPFWFYAIPIPVHYDYLQGPLRVLLRVRPKSRQITFEPSQVFFRGSNEVKEVTVSPKSIWQDKNWLGTNTPAMFPITNSAMFYFEFPPWDRAPFQLSVEGIKRSGQVVSLPPITFEPKTVVRLEFRLPY